MTDRPYSDVDLFVPGDRAVRPVPARMRLDGRRYDRVFLGRLDRPGLRRALWLLRRQDARPREPNPAAAQYDGLATSGAVRAEYRRRGWTVPRPTRQERA